MLPVWYWGMTIFLVFRQPVDPIVELFARLAPQETKILCAK